MLNTHSLSSGSPESGKTIHSLTICYEIEACLKHFWNKLHLFFKYRSAVLFWVTKSSLGLESRAVAMQCGECQNRAPCRELWEYRQHCSPRLGDVSSDWRSLAVFTYSLVLFLPSSWCWVLCSRASLHERPPVMCRHPHTGHAPQIQIDPWPPLKVGGGEVAQESYSLSLRTRLKTSAKWRPPLLDFSASRST